MIATFTDFGGSGPYLGQVRAVLHEQAPGVAVVDLFPDLPAFNVQAAAYLLPAYSQYLPQGCVCFCVVDPGVGSERPGVVVRAAGRWYVGPNEGLFAPLSRRAHNIECWQLPPPGDEVSPSFHGRDVFAPIAARIARNGRFEGEEIMVSELDRPDWPDELHRVVYIDRFGNAITGLRKAAIDPDTVFNVNGYTLRNARTFSDVGRGQAFWYENSNGLVEFSVNLGRADTVLDLQVGTAFGE